MASLWNQLLEFVDGLSRADPTTYLVSLFLLSVGAAIFLPVPIEPIVAVAPTDIPIAAVALVTGLGKGLGAIAVFFIGGTVEGAILRFAKWGWFKWLLDHSERFVRRFGYVALYIIMSIPLMVDTIPLYVFSLLNKEGKVLSFWWFGAVNVAAGTTRALIVLAFRDLFI